MYGTPKTLELHLDQDNILIVEYSLEINDEDMDVSLRIPSPFRSRILDLLDSGALMGLMLRPVPVEEKRSS